MKNEILFYRKFNPDSSKLAPKFIKHLLLNDIILLDFIEDTSNLYSFLSNNTQEEINQVFRKIGENLALTHTLKTTRKKAYETDLPWVFNIHQPNTKLYAEFNAATIDIIKLLQGQKEYAFLLSKASDNWNTSSFIHGDIREGNLLINFKEHFSDVFFVDWEFSGFGDSCWDVGCFFSDLILFWLKSFPIISHIDIKELIKFSGSILVKIQQGINIFFESYKNELKLKGSELYGEKFIIKSIKYTGIRNLQRIIENVIISNRLDRRSIMSIQLSLNLLQSPVFSMDKIFKLDKLI